jgi:hypothetical protein
MTALAVVLGIALLAAAAHAQQYGVHPGGQDPYTGFRRADGITSCCGGHDCHQVPLNRDTGEVQLPDGSWVDPYMAFPGAAFYGAGQLGPDKPGTAHLCIPSAGPFAGKVVCVFIDGQGT